jgi:hypothetical protein
MVERSVIGPESLQQDQILVGLLEHLHVISGRALFIIRSHIESDGEPDRETTITQSVEFGKLACSDRGFEDSGPVGQGETERGRPTCRCGGNTHICEYACGPVDQELPKAGSLQERKSAHLIRAIENRSNFTSPLQSGGGHMHELD